MKKEPLADSLRCPGIFVLMIPLVIITVTAFGGGSAITFPIDSFP